MRELVWLGHRISEKGIRPDMDRVSVLENWRTPTCLYESRAVHGLASYFRKFIRNFAIKTANIRHSLKSKVIAEHGFQWTQKCQEEFKNTPFYMDKGLKLPPSNQCMVFQWFLSLSHIWIHTHKSIVGNLVSSSECSLWRHALIVICPIIIDVFLESSLNQ